jgi:hypothetical protein
VRGFYLATRPSVRLLTVLCIHRFPAHEQISGASKIPTIIYYDRAGNVCAVGAEALTEGIFETAEEEEWVKAEWSVASSPPRTQRGSSVVTF